MKDLKRDAFLMLFVLTACCSAQAHMFGPTGIHGNLSGKTIVVTNVDPLGPAGNGLVKAGDVIIGADGGDSERATQALFKENVRYEFADAIDAAETEKAGGKLVLLLKGERRVVLQLKVLGSYSDTAPYKCPKSDAIITQAAEYLVKSGQAAGGLQVGLLGLLATGEQKYIDVVRDTLRKEGGVHPDMSQLFLHRLGQVCESHGWKVQAWVLMGNHFHLLLEPPEPNLVSGMKWLLSAYSQGWNRAHMRRGHVFQGRYKAVPVIASDSAGDGASWFSKPIRLGRQSGQYDAEIDQKYRKNVNPCTLTPLTTVGEP